MSLDVRMQQLAAIESVPDTLLTEDRPILQHERASAVRTAIVAKENGLAFAPHFVNLDEGNTCYCG